MYANHFKRCLMGLIVCLIAFSLCFTLHFTVGATEGDGTDDTTSATSSEQAVSSESSSTPSDESYTGSTDESSMSSDESSQESVVSDFSQTTSDMSVASVPSEDVISQVSEGGAPDFYDEQYYNNGSYEYHGSYAGLSSSVTSSEAAQQPAKPENRSKLAQKYAKWLTLGMIAFGALSILMLVLLIYFNLKVKESKQTYPDWYRRQNQKKEKQKSKH